MNKANVKVEVLKKTISRLIKAAPAKKAEAAAVDPLTRLIRAFLEYDCDEARSTVAERKIMDAMVDYNELRVTPAIELYGKVDNLFNVDPPIAATAGINPYLVRSVNSALYDVQGRFYHAGIRFSF